MAFVEKKEPAASDPPASSERPKKKTAREPLRVDEVRPRAKKVTFRGAVAQVPRLVKGARIAKAPLDPRDGFVLSMIDGVLSLPELADATGMTEAAVENIVARLVRLGIVSM